MAKYRVKQAEINALQHPGPEKLVVVGRKGEQTAHVGDFIVFYGERPEDREVVTNKDFFDRYELADPTQKTSGDEFGAGDWTNHGDGTAYPVAGVDKTDPAAFENAIKSNEHSEEATATADGTEGGATDL